MLSIYVRKLQKKLRTLRQTESYVYTATIDSVKLERLKLRETYSTLLNYHIQVATFKIGTVTKEVCKIIINGL